MAVRKSLQQTKDDLQTKIDKAGQYWFDRQPADLGNYAGVVVVPGTTNTVYARLENGQVVKVFNNKAPNIYNWKVFVGREKSQPGLFQVVEVRWVYNISQTVAYVLFHHLQHEYPGPDTVWIRRDQFMPLLVLPNNGLHVALFGDVIYTPGMTTPIRVADQVDIDLTAYQPGTGALYLLLEIKPDGTLNYVVGDTYAFISTLRASGLYPLPTPGNFPICVIELYAGQTTIRRDSTERNIIDLRMFTSNTSVDAGSQWHDSTAVTTLVNADEIGIWNSLTSALGKITWANLWTTIKTATDLLYATIAHTHTIFNDGEGDPADVNVTAPADGTSLFTARRDHVHYLAPGAGSYTDEQAQDAVGAMIVDTDTVDITYTDATPELKADVKKQMSISSDSSGLKLSGDSTTPGNDKVYGTDGSGTKGWKPDPTGGGGGITIDQADPYGLFHRLDTPDADDDEFDDGSIAGGWTQINPTGSVAWVENKHALSVVFSGQSANDLGAIVKASTLADGESFETLLRIMGIKVSTYAMAGLVITDGTSNTSNAMALMVYLDMSSGTISIEMWKGTVTNMTTSGTTRVFVPASIIGDVRLRIKRNSSTSFSPLVSTIDGGQFSAFGAAVMNPGFTPSHAGVFATTWGGSTTGLATFDYFRKTA